MKNNRRQQYNMIILNILKDYLEKYPDIRFSQALDNLGIVEKPNRKELPDEMYYRGTYKFWRDEFNLEPEKLLERVANLSTDKNAIKILYTK